MHLADISDCSEDKYMLAICVWAKLDVAAFFGDAQACRILLGMDGICGVSGGSKECGSFCGGQ